MTKGIFIDGITKDELHEILGGYNNVPDIMINAKQAQEVLNCDYRTVMQYVKENLLIDYGKKRPQFRLRDAIDLKKDNPKYKRFRELP
jgi:hypothetical protein